MVPGERCHRPDVVEHCIKDPCLQSGTTSLPVSRLQASHNIRLQPSALRGRSTQQTDAGRADIEDSGNSRALRRDGK